MTELSMDGCVDQALARLLAEAQNGAKLSFSSDDPDERSQTLQEINLLQTSYHILGQRIRNHVDHTTRHLNSHVPIYRLPNELLVRIFAFTSTVDQYLKHLVWIGLVSRYWSRIIFETPSLWARISSSYNYQANEAAIIRSRGHPLLVDYNEHDRRGLMAMGQWRPFLILATREAYRWQAASFHMVYKSALAILRNYVNLPAPMLEDLKISLKEHGEVTLVTESLDIFGGGADRLRHLDLYQFPIHWDSRILSRLGTLKISAEKLSYRPTTNQIIDILRRCPNLLAFQLRYRGQVDTHVSVAMLETEPVDLLVLTSFTLDLDGPKAFHQILSSVRIPACTTFALACSSTTSDTLGYLPAALLSAIQRLPKIEVRLSASNLALTGWHDTCEPVIDICLHRSSPWDDLAWLINATNVDIFGGGSDRRGRHDFCQLPITDDSRLVSRLETLKISAEKLSHRPSTNKIMDILHQCPNLHAFQLRYRGQVDTHVSVAMSKAESVDLPVLTSFALDLDDPEAFYQILSSIHIPACTTFALSCTRTASNPLLNEGNRLPAALLSAIQHLPNIEVRLSASNLTLTGWHDTCEPVIDICLDRSSPWDDFARLINPTNTGTPHGESERHRHLDLYWPPTNWDSGLETLTISAENLSQPPSTSRIMDTLRRCPNLIAFELRYRGEWDNYISVTPLEVETIDLPSLTAFTLDLDDAVAFRQIIASVRIPACITFVLRCRNTTGNIFRNEAEHLTIALLSTFRRIAYMDLRLSASNLALTGWFDTYKPVINIYLRHDSPWEDLAWLINPTATGSGSWPPIDAKISCDDSLLFRQIIDLLRGMPSIRTLEFAGNSDQYITQLSRPTLDGIHDWVLPNLRELWISDCPRNSTELFIELQRKLQGGVDMDRGDELTLVLPRKLEILCVRRPDGFKIAGPFYAAFRELYGDHWNSNVLGL
ncbi:hypothetical protein FRB94_003517 [Tulasnella sp. JGI-2019a]|nr:hypothetical protein FRB94_003517 [Tulasnella sp. JGI-2019a]